MTASEPDSRPAHRHLPPLPRAVDPFLRMPPGVRASFGLTGFFLLGLLAFICSVVLASGGLAKVMPFLGLSVIFAGGALTALYLGLRGSRAGAVGGVALVVAVVVVAVLATTG